MYQLCLAERPNVVALMFVTVFALAKPCLSRPAVVHLCVPRARTFLRSWRVGIIVSHTYQLVSEHPGRQLCPEVWSRVPTVQAPTRHWSAGVREANDCDSGFWQFLLKPVPKARSCEKFPSKRPSGSSGEERERDFQKISVQDSRQVLVCERVWDFCGQVVEKRSGVS